jgi:hypothetical protein
VGESVAGLGAQLAEYHADNAKRLDSVEKRLGEVASVQGKIEYQVTLTASEAAKTNGRLKDLERWQQRLIGGAALGFLLVTLGAGYFLK